jgi:predicted enzyme related to lactoylglutathione lyase
MKARATNLYPFVPSGPDFANARAFFAEIGFDTLWEHDGLAGLKFGEAYFMLQDIDVPEWQTNQMITFEVDDLETYWSQIEAKDLSRKYPGVRTRPPTDFPWGREIHIVDPAGVCWHVRQARRS